MENDNQDGIIVDVEEANNEGGEESAEVDGKPEAKPEKPKRTPQEEYEYHQGRAERLAKKLGLKKPEVKNNSSEPSELELDYGKKAYLKSYGIQGSDELELVKTEIKRSGMELDELVSNEYFIGKLNNLRAVRESSNAIPKSKNRSGQTGVTDLDLAVAKFNETGELPTDFKLKNQVIDAITKKEKGEPFV